MASLWILSAAVFLVLLLLGSWHARVRAVREAQRLEAEGARGRELESIAMDAASLLSAILLSLETARDVVRSASGEEFEELEDTARAANALSTLFSATRLYMQPTDFAIRGSAEGCVRVAVAVARSRGFGISVRGEQTALTLRGGARSACQLVTELLDACRATLGADDAVEVRLEADEVQLVGGTGPAFASLPTERAALLGWSVEPVSLEGRAAVRIRACSPDDRGILEAAEPGLSRVVH